MADSATFGLDPAIEEAYLQALAQEDPSLAAARFAPLRGSPGHAAVFHAHHVEALLRADEREEAVRLFREGQDTDPVARAAARTVRFFLGEEKPVVAPELRRLASAGAPAPGGTGTLANIIKLRDGHHYYALDGPLPEGVVVVDGILGKHTGDDESFRIEVDHAGRAEAVTVNANLGALGSSSHALRLPFQGRLHTFRLAVGADGAVLWVDGVHRVASEGGEASRQPGVRLGLMGAGGEQLDTLFFLAAIRIALGLPGEARDWAPLDDEPRDLANLAVLLDRLGRFRAAAQHATDAFGARPTPAQSDACARVLERAVREAGRRDVEVRRHAERAVRLATPEVAKSLAEAAGLGPRPVAVACRDLSIYYSRNPQRVVHPLDLYRRLRDPQGYFDANYRWAVQDVSFELHYGDVLAIIGNNGAGKSTLLRALAGMIDHTGALAIYGDARLLVMGLGVQEDLTGRENIVLGCLYLGLRKRVVVEKVQSILEFAELTEFADVPYRFYSDGMKARLLFAIATSVEPDILFLDELLGAGDVRFRAKAIARMDEIISRSKAMIVVTHNMNFVRERATHALYLDRGKVRYCGDPNRAVDLYLSDNRLGDSQGTFALAEV